MIKSVRFQDVILPKSELGIHMCTNGPWLQIHTHSKTGSHYLGIPPAGFLGFQSRGKQLVPDPPLESPDSPYFTTGLTTDMRSQSLGVAGPESSSSISYPPSSTHQAIPTASKRFLRSWFQRVNTSIFQSAVHRTLMQPMFHTHRTPQQNQFVKHHILQSPPAL